jgi:putative sigma-54 modulation protein
LDIKIVKGKNSEVSDELKEYLALKLAKLTRYGGRLESAVVTLTEHASKKPDKSFKVEVVLHAPGQMLRNVDAGASFTAALDTAVDELRGQLKKLKTKRIDKHRDSADIAQVLTAEAQPAPEKKPGRDMQIKKFNVKPMGLNEALLRLETGKRGFFLFVTEQKRVNCVFKRSDGGYGLLVPETEIIQ